MVIASRKIKKSLVIGISVILVLYLVISLSAGEGPGRVVKPDRNVQVAALISGTVTSMAKVGQRVAVGDVLAEVSTRLGVSITARSPINGKVVRTYITVGDDVDVGQILFSVNR